VTVFTSEHPGQHPVVVRLNAERAAAFELRLADRITAFSGSMKFFYLHALAFALWMLVVERSPWPTLTLAVSLEAVFLSAFVMIGQNRQAAFQQAKADHDFVEEVQELKLNTELTREVHDLTRDLHERVLGTQDTIGTIVAISPSAASAAATPRRPGTGRPIRRHPVSPRTRAAGSRTRPSVVRPARTAGRRR
jgi:uncharacterized membrane protein